MSDTEAPTAPDRVVIPWRIPLIFGKLLTPKRNKVFWGGRGAAKTRSVATIIAGLLYQRMPINGQPFRVLCGREYQNSIGESSHYEIVAAIHRLRLSDYFKIGASSILCRTTGAHVFYRGLHDNIDSLKSMGDIDLFWGEEAHTFSQVSIEKIGPTLRRDAPFGPFGTGSELWFTLNQENDDDPIYTHFKLSNGSWEDERTMVVACTYKDNPYFPDTLEKDRRHDELYAPAGVYEWKWGTACRNMGGIFFDMRHMLANNEPVEWPKISDSIFAVIDTAVKTGQEHDATAVLYCAYNKHGSGYPLTLLDYDLVQIEGSLLEQWLPAVDRTINRLCVECGSRFGAAGIFIEDKQSGTILLQQASRRGIKAHAIDSKLTAMGKSERALNASGYVARGMVKISRPCYDHLVTYKGVTLNHLLSQIKSFRVGDERTGKADDALDTFTYAVTIALGNAEGF